MITQNFMLVDSPPVFMIFRFVMSNNQATYNVLYFHRISCSVIPTLTLVPYLCWRSH
jgi:hypothetical protein